jgi:hypothetical protein
LLSCALHGAASKDAEQDPLFRATPEAPRKRGFFFIGLKVACGAFSLYVVGLDALLQQFAEKNTGACGAFSVYVVTWAPLFSAIRGKDTVARF